MNNKQRMLDECSHILKLNRRGAKSTQRSYRDVMRIIIDDLYQLTCLPKHWHGLTDEALAHLIQHWRKKGKKNRTIANRVGILRGYFKLVGIQHKMPTNKTLDLSDVRKIKQTKLCDNIIDKVYHPVTKSIMAFELYFGLTKMESIKFTVNQATSSDRLFIYRHIAYNHRDRVIPIRMECQRQAIAERVSLLGDKDSLLSVADINCLSGLYRGELMVNGLHDGPLHRQYYAKMCYRYLTQDNRQHGDEPIETIQHELGLTSKHALRVWVNE